MTSTKPYLIRAIYEWIAANDCTPYIMVNARLPSVIVPQKHVKNGLIVLSISSLSTKNLKITDEEISFEAKFEGSAFNILLPIDAVISIFTKENGRGMIFTPDFDRQMGVEPSAPMSKPKPAKPHLTLIKNTD